MFRLQENVPEVYVKQSRDFQLFCRIYDVIDNALRFNAKSTENLLSPLQTSDRMLQLLATRVGFFPQHEYDTEALRQVISAFPYIVKYKGSKQGIEMALNVILKLENNYKESFVIIDNNEYVVKIYTKTKIQGEDLLRDVLSYILPIGYDIEVNTYIDAGNLSPTQLSMGISSVQPSVDNKNTSIVIKEPIVDDNITGSYTTTLILNQKNLGDQSNE